MSWSLSQTILRPTNIQCPRPHGIYAESAPSKGGALHNRKDCLGFVRPYSPRRPSAARPHSIRTENLGIRTALPCGRTECAPPRKPPFGLSQGLPRNPLFAPWPFSGGAGSARPLKHAWAWPRHVPGRPQASRLVVGCKWNSSADVWPYHAGAQSAPL